MLTPTVPNSPDTVELVSHNGNPIASPLFIPAPELGYIPTEIWQHIFALLVITEQHIVCEEMLRPAVGRESHQPPYFSKASCLLPRMPATLSHVCVRWREIAYGMPEIWSVLCINAPCTGLNDAGMQKLRKMGALITLWLARSASFPLKLSVVAKKNVYGAQTILRSLLPACAQWEALHIDIPYTALSVLGTLRPGDVPLLTSVSIHERFYTLLQGQSVNPASVDKFHLCRISDSLCRFSTSSLPTAAHDNTFCSHLQEVQIQESPSETWATLRFLAACRQLRVLTLSGYGTTVDLSAIQASPALTLPELETLNLEHPFGRDWLLRMLFLPKLKSVYLGGRCSGGAALILNEIMGLVKRSGLDSLQHISLELESHGLDHSGLIDFLRANPTLRILDIDDFGIFMDSPLVTTELFDALTVPHFRRIRCQMDSAARMICPHLETVSFTNCSRFDDEALLRFLQSRSTHRRVIQTSRHDWVQAESGERSISVLESVDVTFKRRMRSAALDTWKKETFVMNGPSA